MILKKYNTFTGISQVRLNQSDLGGINREHIIQTRDRWPSACTCLPILPNSPRFHMNRYKISISRCIPLLSLKSERETKQKRVVAMLPCENPLCTESWCFFSKKQHLCIASHKPLIRPLFLTLSCDPATRRLLSTHHKCSFI